MRFGAPTADVGSYLRAGLVDIYIRNRGAFDWWDYLMTFTAGTTANENGGFGASVAIDGDILAIGAHHADPNGTSGAGAVYLFQRDPVVSDSWYRLTRLTAGDGQADDMFGSSVDISGDHILVGAAMEASGRGAAYVFERNGGTGGSSDSWGQIRKLVPAERVVGDRFGQEVALDVDTAAVSAYMADFAGDNAGAVFIFERNQHGADNWGEVRRILPADPADQELAFGTSLGVSNGVLAIGAPQDGDYGASAGAVYVYRIGAATVYLPLVVRN